MIMEQIASLVSSRHLLLEFVTDVDHRKEICLGYNTIRETRKRKESVSRRHVHLLLAKRKVKPPMVHVRVHLS